MGDAHGAAGGESGAELPPLDRWLCRGVLPRTGMAAGLSPAPRRGAVAKDEVSALPSCKCARCILIVLWHGNGVWCNIPSKKRADGVLSPAPPGRGSRCGCARQGSGKSAHIKALRHDLA